MAAIAPAYSRRVNARVGSDATATATAAASAKASAAEPLSAADARLLVGTVERQRNALKRQQREIDQLREQVKSG